MAADWLQDTRRAFKRHRLGRPGWHLQVHRDRLRILSAELPPRPGEPDDAPAQRSYTLTTPPGPSTAAAALAEACEVFDQVLAGTWSWPGPDGAAAGQESPLSPANLQRLINRLRDQKVGEVMQEFTWRTTWALYLNKLVQDASEDSTAGATALLIRYLRRWAPQSRGRQMAHDRARALWRFAGWEWPATVATMRGNGKAAANPAGVRAFTDAEIQDLRARLLASRFGPADLVTWDCMISFGLRPKELDGLELFEDGGTLFARVTRAKVSTSGSSGLRTVPAVPPTGWPADCYGLLQRWKTHGLSPAVLGYRSPGKALSRQLRILGIADELTSYGLRHSFAIRCGVDLGLHVREAAQLLGHSVQVHCVVYGRRLDTPALLQKVARLSAARSGLTPHPAPATRSRLG